MFPAGIVLIVFELLGRIRQERRGSQSPPPEI